MILTSLLLGVALTDPQTAPAAPVQPNAAIRCTIREAKLQAAKVQDARLAKEAAVAACVPLLDAWLSQANARDSRVENAEVRARSIATNKALHEGLREKMDEAAFWIVVSERDKG
jgi:hypothetical protein